MSVQNDGIWHGAYKIPWDDPDFSRRMLREHLSQDHDMASRRTEWIDKQVAWIHEHLLGGKPSSILDLSCGPGFYSHRLAARGHRCCGIDFGPASIEYAREHNPDHSQCTFVLGDIRHAPFGGPYDLAMILFGEFNVFAPAEALTILQKVRVSLHPDGRLTLEIQSYEAVERAGHSEPSEQQCQSGLFSDQPYHCRTENRWLPDEEVTVQTFSITEETSGRRQAYHSTTRAWSDAEMGQDSPTSANWQPLQWGRRSRRAVARIGFTIEKSSGCICSSRDTCRASRRRVAISAVEWLRPH